MLAEFARQCGLAFMSQQNIIMTLFLGGLVGGVTHCAGMCGPFVISQAAARLETAPPQCGEWSRLRGAALLPYHLGRMTTYSLMGLGASALAMPFSRFTWFPHFAALLLGVAGLLFLLQALRLAGWALPRRWPRFSLSLPSFLHPMLRRLFAAPMGWRGYALGLTLGFLPCGLVYAGLLAVAARADWGVGLLGMAAFALGTMPALILVGMGGHYVAGRFGAVIRYVAPIIMGTNAVTLFLMAGGMAK